MLPICQQEGGQCPCVADGENLALDEELSEQVEILKITLWSYDATQNPHALRPFEAMGINDDILSYAEIIHTWNLHTASKRPES